ncbi:MAG: hypothetical protein LUQ67_08235 [Methanomicrobiales archaeon]|nr:hypothetical protein [Methanomicrobiales archaeon]
MKPREPFLLLKDYNRGKCSPSSMEWYQSKIILICLPVIIVCTAFLILVAPPLPDADQEFIRQAADYERATTRFQDEMVASPWDGNFTQLEIYGRRERILADQYFRNLSGLPVVKLYGYRQEMLRALEYEKASSDDMISASIAFREGEDSAGLALLERATEQKKMQFGHMDRASMLFREAVVANQLRYVPTG